MGKIEFVDESGSFCLKNPQDYSYLYFPVAGEDGIRSCLTPLLGGDAKKTRILFCMSRSARRTYITTAAPEISGVGSGRGVPVP